MRLAKLEAHPTGSELGWSGRFAFGLAVVSIGIAIIGFSILLFRALPVDFLSFWSAGRLVLDGHPSAAYNIAVHREIEKSVVPSVGLIPFPYPPPFLAIVAPFALMPFSIGFILWVLVTSLVYALGAARSAPLSYAFANPPVLVDFMIGQTGLLLGGLFILGLTLLSAAPVAAGAILGLLVLKPQLALMLPVALIAGARWKAIAGALLSSTALLTAGLLLFGRESYAGFFSLLPHYIAYVRISSWNWAELASPFAFARYLGIGETSALVAHGIVALAAGCVTWIAWSRDWSEKIPILAAATLLASPYLMTYDAVLLIVPAGHLLCRRQFWAVALLWLLTAFPVIHFYSLYEGPNTIPVGAVVSLWMMVRSHFLRSNIASSSGAESAAA